MDCDPGRLRERRGSRGDELFRRPLVGSTEEPDLLKRQRQVPRGHGTLWERRHVADRQFQGRPTVDLDARRTLKDEHGLALW